MNIGIVTTWFERGAAYVSRQYKQVLSQEHQVFIFARGGEAYAKGNPQWDTPDVTWAKRQPYTYLTGFNLNEFKDWLQHNNIELVIFNEQHWWPPILLCRDLGLTVGTYVDYYTEITLPFFDIYDFLLCNTKRHHSAFEWHPQCLYIPWGTDLSVYKPTTTDSVQPGIVTFFHSAGMSPHRKGTDLVIQAFEQLPDSTRLIIHAQRHPLQFFPQLETTVQQLEAKNRLDIIEKTVTAPGLYHLGDVYVYPTRLEGIGLTIAEAMACGTPVIVTDNPPMNEFVVDGENGHLVETQRLIARADGYYWPQAIVSLNSLCETMRYYHDHAVSLKEFKNRARSYAEQHLNWDTNAAMLSEQLQNVRKRDANHLQVTRAAIEDFEKDRHTLAKQFPRLAAAMRKIVFLLGNLWQRLQTSLPRRN